MSLLSDLYQKYGAPALQNLEGDATGALGWVKNAVANSVNNFSHGNTGWQQADQQSLNGLVPGADSVANRLADAGDALNRIPGVQSASDFIDPIVGAGFGHDVGASAFAPSYHGNSANNPFNDTLGKYGPADAKNSNAGFVRNLPQGLNTGLSAVSAAAPFIGGAGAALATTGGMAAAAGIGSALGQYANTGKVNPLQLSTLGY